MNFYKFTTLLLLSLTGSIASAQVVLLEPSFRGDGGTLFSGWTDFSATTDVAPNFSGTLGTISELSGTSMVTGSQNIYNPAGPSMFQLDLSADLSSDFLLLQVVTQGTELDYGSVELTYIDAVDGETTLACDLSQALGSESLGGFGSKVGTAFEWDLTGLGIDTFSLNFNASGAHLSLDEVYLDFGSSMTLAAVPEPSTYALFLALAGFCAVLFRRRYVRASPADCRNNYN